MINRVLGFFTTLASCVAISLMFAHGAGAAGHIAPSGITEEGASQLVAWYDQTQSPIQFGRSAFQVTNLSTDTGVNIHVQIFADEVDGEPPLDLCREHDFTDTLTPADTILYLIGSLDEVVGPDPPLFGGNNAHVAIAINVDFTRGFIVATAVNNVTLPRQAVSHNYLFGTMLIRGVPAPGSSPGYSNRMNAQGRQAVDFATGDLAAAGTVLDGVATGLRVIQPTILSFMFDDTGGTLVSSINSIAFSDNYSDPSGEYRAEPATQILDPIIFDDEENGVSCQQHTHTCFVSHGVNDEWTAVIDPGDSDDVICPASDEDDGWMKIAVSGLGGLDNAFGLASFTEFGSPDFAHGTWMHGE